MSRALPSSPSLEQLKRQAKDLLKASHARDLQALRARLAGPAELVEISSLYGPDAFLKEADALRPVLARALESAENAS